MELRQLACFVAIVDERSFTRAADRLHVAQPGVSAQIQRLEAELGVRLLDRGRGAAEPTAAGLAVLPHARAALDAAGRVAASVDALRGFTSGRATLGVVTSTPFDVVGMLASFRDLFPGIDLGLRTAASEELLAGIGDGTLDVAVAGLGSEAVPAGLETLDLFDDALVGIVAPAHPLAERRRVTVAELAEHALICLPRGSGLRDLLERGCDAAGAHAHVAFEAGDPATVVAMAARGLGVAVVPRSLSVPEGTELRVLQVVDPVLRGRLALCWRSSGASGPAGEALLQHVRAAWSVE